MSVRERPTHRVLAVAALLVLGRLADGAPPQPSDLLGRSLSTPVVAFRGIQRTTVYHETGSTTSDITVHSDGAQRVRKEFRTGPAAGATMLHTPAAVYQKSADGAWRRLPASRDQEAAVRARLIRANYAVSQRPGPKVCGRTTVLITIAAKRSYNPSRKLTVDKATGVPLVDELFAPNSSLRSRTQYTEWKPGKQPAGLFVTPQGATPEGAGFGPASFEARSGAAAVQQETGRPVPAPVHVPDGYIPSAFGVMTTGSGMRTPAVRYSDGVASFTILQRGSVAAPRPRGWGWGRMGAGPRGQGRGRMGPGGPWQSAPTLTEDRQGATVLCSSRTTAYVLVGDLAGSELLLIARSLP